MKTTIVSLLFFAFCFTIYGQKRDKTIKVFEGQGLMNSSRMIYDGTGEGFSKFPVQAADTGIRILILDNNNIEEIPNWIASLQNLRVLSIRNNNLREVNPVILSCKNLEMLFISGNPNLTELPSLGQLDKLILVDALDTGISEVPTTMWGSNSLYYFKYTKKPKNRDKK